MDNTQQLLACLQPVESRMFSKAGYSEDFWTLILVFKSTKEIKGYRNVAPEVADAALSAKSLGKWWNANVKGNPAWEAEVIGVDEPEPAAEKSKDQVEGGITDADIRSVDPSWTGTTLLSTDHIHKEYGGIDRSQTTIEQMPPKQAHITQVADWPYDFGVKEYDPQTGHWPSSAVNEDGTVKEEAIAAAITKQTEGEILPAWTAPGSAAEALDLLAEREGEIAAIIQQCKDTADKALTVRVASSESRIDASEVLNRLVERKDKAVELLDPFRKILYESYTYANDLKKSAVDPLEAGVKAVKGQILSWDQQKERERQEALRKARDQAEAEARRLQEAERQRLTLLEVEDKLDQGDEQGAQTLFDAPMIDVPKPYVPVQHIAPSAPVIEGQSSRSNWKVVEEDINMVEFLRAVKMDKFPLEQAAQLIKPDLVELNRLAKALKTAFNVPGMRADDQGSISVRRKK
jgi:KTSC domain